MKKRKAKVRTWETSLSLAQMIIPFFLCHPFILTHGSTYILCLRRDPTNTHSLQIPLL